LIKFRLDGHVYTADLVELVQKRQAKPHTERAIRRSMLAGGPKIAAMVQMVESFKQEIAQREQQLMTDLQDAVATIESPSVMQVQWECATDSGWVAYGAAVNAALEAGYKVRAMFCDTLPLQSYFLVLYCCMCKVFAMHDSMCSSSLSSIRLHCCAQAYTAGQLLSTHVVPFIMSGVTYNASFVAMAQQRTDGRYNTKRAIRRVEHEVTRQLAPPKQIHTAHALIASEPLQWATQPTVIVTTATATAAAAASTANAGVTSLWNRGSSSSSSSGVALTSSAGNSAGSSSSTNSTATATALTVHKYELHGGAALNTSVTLNNVIFSLAAGLFERGVQPVVLADSMFNAVPAVGYGVPGHNYAIPSNGNGLVQKVDVYSNPVTRAKYLAKRQQLAAQGVSTAEIWVFHGTTSAANVHSIMTEGFKVSYIIVALTRA
jgi:WWE domain